MTAPWHSFESAFSDGTSLKARFTTRDAGDFGIGAPSSELNRRRRLIVDRPWLWLRQVHSTTVVHMSNDTSLPEVLGSEADASVTARRDIAISVTVADCAPVLLWAENGAFGVVHAGWQGLLDGILNDAVTSLAALAADTTIQAVLGPCIHPDSYEFGEERLNTIESRFGPSVRGTTTSGEPALDLPAAVMMALQIAGVSTTHRIGGDTADSDCYFSHRNRQELERQVLVAWRT